MSWSSSDYGPTASPSASTSASASTTFAFPALGITFSAQFDSGNLAAVALDPVPGLSPSFLLHTRPDPSSTCRTWFFFSVAGMRCNETYVFTIVNLNSQSKLYAQGLRPFVRVGEQGTWTRIETAPTWNAYNDGKDKGMRLQWSHRCRAEVDAGRTVFFAFSYPFTYSESQLQARALDTRYGFSLDPLDRQLVLEQAQRDPSAIYFNRSLLTYSLQGRRIELLTITSFRNATGATERALAPESHTAPLFPDDQGQPRILAFADKPVVFVSARVHPGETPSSHVLNGIIDFALRKDDARAAAFRDRFVLKIVPMINPDGVALGNYRSDTRGTNLNRFYTAPDSELHPSVWAVKQYLRHLGNVEFYLDLHAHAQKRGCFLYGNSVPDLERQVDIMLYAKLAALNTAHLDFEASNFTEENMTHKDKRDGLSKEGSGRVAIHKDLGITYAYTLECNYNTGRVLNPISAVAGAVDRGRASPERPVRPGMRPPEYDLDVFAEVGRGLAVAMLDIKGWNPWSRIPTSTYRSMEHIRTFVRSVVNASMQKQHQQHHAGTTADPFSSSASGILTQASQEKQPNGRTAQPTAPPKRAVHSFSSSASLAAPKSAAAPAVASLRPPAIVPRARKTLSAGSKSGTSSSASTATAAATAAATASTTARTSAPPRRSVSDNALKAKQKVSPSVSPAIAARKPSSGPAKTSRPVRPVVSGPSDDDADDDSSGN